jgi:hypothetical protein
MRSTVQKAVEKNNITKRNAGIKGSYSINSMPETTTNNTGLKKGGNTQVFGKKDTAM